MSRPDACKRGCREERDCNRRCAPAKKDRGSRRLDADADGNPSGFATKPTYNPARVKRAGK